MKKFAAIPFLLLLPALLLSGCWDLTEPENLSLITVIGINTAGNSQYEVVMQDQTLIPGSQQVQKSNWTFDIHKSTGSTISDAIQKNTRTNPEKIYLSHTKAIIISEELVRQLGIRPVIDFLERSPEIRNAIFLISKKGEFEKIFLPNAKYGMDTGKIIENLIKNAGTNSFLYESNWKDFMELYWGSYTTPYALGVGTAQSFMDNKSTGQSYDDAHTDTYDIEVGDIALFKGDKMAGWLTGDKSRGFLWVTGKVKGGNVSLDYQGKQIIVKISHVKSKITPLLENEMKIDLTTALEADIQESSADIDFNDKNIIDQIREILDARITDEIRESIDASKSLSTDIFGFGNCFFENYPNYWKQNKDRWPDSYSKLKVNIQVTSDIQHIGLTKKSKNTGK